MIDESPAAEEFKRGQRGKLDALLALAEAHDCRRVRLLAYFGEAAATPLRQLRQLPEPARHLGRDRGRAQGAVVHLPLPPARRPALRRRPPDRRAARQGDRQGHAVRPRAACRTFGIGADLSEAQWRGVLRQLIALGHLRTEGEYNTLELTASAREVLRGEVPLLLRVPATRPSAARGRAAQGAAAARAASAPPLPLDDAGRAALRRAEGLARRGRARAQPAGLRRLPRRHAGRDGARPARLARRAGAASAASARRSSRPTAARSCACSARRAERRTHQAHGDRSSTALSASWPAPSRARAKTRTVVRPSAGTRDVPLVGLAAVAAQALWRRRRRGGRRPRCRCRCRRPTPPPRRAARRRRPRCAARWRC